MRAQVSYILYCCSFARVLARGPSSSNVCPDAAESYLYSDLNTTETLNYCLSTILTGTIALCLAQRFPDQVSSYWNTFGSSYYCTRGSLPDYESTLANATVYLAPAPESQLNVTDSPFLIPDDIYRAWYKTDYGYYDNIYLAQTYGWVIVVLGCAVMFFAGLLRLLKHLIGSNLTPSSGLMKSFKKHVTLPALIGKAHARRPSLLGPEFSIPSRLESLFLLAFITINIIFSFCSFHIFSGNYYWPLTIVQFQRYVADRSGILAFAQFPFLFAFAGRNTIFIWLTGWSYQSFSTFHKWVARMSVYHAFVHTVMYTMILFKEDGAANLASSYQDAYLRWGAVAMVSAILMIFFSIYSIRKRWYELFLISHILLAIVWLLGSYYHVKLLDEEEYLPWLWTAVAFWGFDRSIRVLRLIVTNVIRAPQGGGKQLSTVSAVGDGVLKVTIPVSQHWTSSPGQYIFLYFPEFKVWQSHPFTILDVSSPDASPSFSLPSSPASPVNGADKSDRIVSVTDTTTSRHAHSTADNKQLTVLFRAHKGITATLLSKSLSRPSFKTKVWVEGPYGTSHSLHEFSTVMLMSAGLGITATLPFLKTCHYEQRIVVHWIIRNERSVDWVKDELSAMVEGNEKVEVTVHVTHPGLEKTRMPRSLRDDQAIPDTISINSGRPKIQQLLASEIDVCGERERIGVLACGPGGFMDDARDGVKRLLSDGTNRALEYFEESFTW